MIETRLMEASLGQFSDALAASQPWGRDKLEIDDFFAGRHGYSQTEEWINLYQHHIAQWSLKDFFEKELGLVPLASPFSFPTVTENIEYEVDKTFSGYASGRVCYETKDGKERLFVNIAKRTPDEIVYTVYMHPDRQDVLTRWSKFARANNFYKGKRITAGCSFLDLRDKTWDDVVLPEGTRKLLQSVILRSIDHEQIMLKNGLSLKSGILLKGAPGNGKTTVLKVLIKEVGPEVTVIYAQPSHLSYASDVKGVCEMAKDLAPSILILEDMDWIATERDISTDPAKVIELMNALDGIEEQNGVITIGTTNHADRIEAAVKNRPGRFDRVIEIPNPDEDCRRRMISLFTRRWKLSDGVQLDRVIKETEDLSGAHMADLCKTAARKAIEAGSYGEDQIAVVREEDFSRALAEVKNVDYSQWLKTKRGDDKKITGFGNGVVDDEIF
jgi:AAA+ superfamily predicted ATPase